MDAEVHSNHLNSFEENSQDVKIEKSIVSKQRPKFCYQVIAFINPPPFRILPHNQGGVRGPSLGGVNADTVGFIKEN